MPDDSVPLLAPHGAAVLSDKRQATASFFRAAASYGTVTEFQCGVDESLLSTLLKGFSPRRWVGLGCGAGHFSRALERRSGATESLAVGITKGMLWRTRVHDGANHFIDGDAERLPLRDDSCDPLFSSPAIQ